jgi:hypothetical protein
VVRWANGQGGRWAFSLSNAGARYTEFVADVADLGRLNWAAIAATDFRNERIKEGKQAESLVHGRFPFTLVERIGVGSEAVRLRAAAALRGSGHRPLVQILRDWYYR